MRETIRKYRIELITFAIALTVSSSYLVWSELQKPRNGIFRYLQREVVVRHKDTGEVLGRGRSKRHVVERHLRRLYAEEDAGEMTGGEAGRRARYFGGRGGGPVEPYQLEGAHLGDVDFSGADLRRLWLRNALCDRANFEGAQLSETRLTRTSFYEANLSAAQVRQADLTDANLARARLVQTDFSESNLHGAAFQSSDISGAVFNHADCTGANFSEVVFDTATSFEGANLSGALNISPDLRSQAERTGARWDEAVAAGESAPSSP
jgi:hypothetical protein